jgi:diamine N-acetyltransferase
VGESPYALAGERAALGPLRKELIPTYARWVNDPETRRGLLYGGLLTMEAEEEWYEAASRAGAGVDPEAAHFTIYDRRDDAPVGVLSLERISHRFGRAELGIVLGERRGQGIGTDAVRLALDWAFNHLGLHNVMLETDDWNTAALRAYEKAGFRELGRRRGGVLTRGRRNDSVLMDAVADEFDSPVLRPAE